MEEFCSKIAVLCHGRDLRKYGECLEVLYTSFEASEKYLGEVDPQVKKDMEEMMELSREFLVLLTDQEQVKLINDLSVPARMRIRA